MPSTEILHVLPRQLPLVGGVREHAGHGAVRRRRHERIAQDRPHARRQGGEDDEAWFDACVQRRRHRARPAPRNSAPRIIRFRRRRSICAPAITIRWASASARRRTSARSMPIAPRSSASISSSRCRARKIEIVDVPFEGKKLPGYFVPAQNAKSARARRAWCSSTASTSPRRSSSCAACPTSSSAAFRCW